MRIGARRCTRSRIYCLIFIIFTLSLASCTTGGSPASARSAAEKIAPLFETVQSLTARVTILVNRGTLENEFTLSWTATASESAITVIAPDAVAGVSVHISADGRSVAYDGAALTLPDTVSPLELLPWMLSSWRDGVYAEAVADNTSGVQAVVVTYRDTIAQDIYECRTRFDAARLTPLAAEVSVNGVRMAAMRFDTVTLG